MGICASGPPDPYGVQKSMKAQERKDEGIKKLLLLGAGGSGKSTVFKQLKSIHGPGMEVKERKSYKSIVVGNVIDFMKTLVEQSKRLSQGDRDAKPPFGPMAQCKYDDRLEEFAEIIEDQPANFFPKELDEEIGDAIVALWGDRGIKTTFDERSKFQMQDSASYFFDQRMDDIRRPEYIPTEQDVLRSRVRTTGIVEQEFLVEKHRFRVFDVGGQRNERRKWMHCFDNVTGVIFVASMSGYDQMLLEDEGTNRMVEALDLFAQINDGSGKYGSERNKELNKKKFKQMGSHFVDKPMILFLNKSDLYEIKVEKVSLAACPYFKEYKYPMFRKNSKKKKKNKDEPQQMSKFDDGVEFVKHKFMLRNTHSGVGGRKKTVYTHVTNATDKNIIKKVFLDVQHILISQSLGEAGIL